MQISQSMQRWLDATSCKIRSPPSTSRSIVASNIFPVRVTSGAGYTLVPSDVARWNHKDLNIRGAKLPITNIQYSAFTNNNHLSVNNQNKIK